jgi:2-(1,2-epoxy-1,2-dihydrophenyl)acetyl-CoA isomerase
MFQTVIYEAKDGLGKITLNRPKVLNAFNQEMHNEVYEVLNQAADDPSVRCIVIEGSGRGFSAGADLSSVTQTDMGSVDLGDYLRNTYNRLLLRMVEVEKPIVASIHGPAFGAGLGIALACDFRIAANSSTYCQAFIKIGLIPDAGNFFFLPRIVGLSRAMELAALGDTIGAEEAHRLGLVNRIVPDEKLAEETEAFADRLAQMPTKALALIKKTMYKSFENDLATMLEEEAEGQNVMGKTSDHLEGVQAFFQKRKPHFKGE